MKKLFTTYQIASKLKELGFDEPCLMYYYNDDENKLHSNVSTSTLYGAMISEEGFNKDRQIKAPLWQQAIHWLLNYIQNNKNLYIKVTIYADNSYIVDSIVNNLDYHFVLKSNQDLLNKLLEILN